jgi:hypothetical protein
MNNKGSFFFVALIFLLGSLSACDPNASTFPQMGPQTNVDNVKMTTIKYSVRQLTSSTEWTYLAPENVDITLYRSADSVTFAASLRCQQSDAFGIAELYNFDDENPISGSQVVSNVRAYFKYVESQDILPRFPKEKVQIGIRIRSSEEGVPIEISYESAINIYTH